MIGMPALARKPNRGSASDPSESRVKVQRFLVRAIALGFGFVAFTLVSGAWILLDRTRQTALHAADMALQNAALIVQSLVNRQFLQIDGALASLPALFAAVARNGADSDPQSAGRLLRGLNFQAFAFRDIIMLRSNGGIWASARQSEWVQDAPALLTTLNSAARTGAAAIVGPVRTPFTGDWVLLVVRRMFIPGSGILDAVAEVPLPLIAKQLSAVGDIPGLQVSLERRDGQLLLNQPYDEMRIGEPQRVAISQIQANGTVLFMAGIGENIREWPLAQRGDFVDGAFQRKDGGHHVGLGIGIFTLQKVTHGLVKQSVGVAVGDIVGDGLHKRGGGSYQNARTDGPQAHGEQCSEFYYSRRQQTHHEGLPHRPQPPLCYD